MDLYDRLYHTIFKTNKDFHFSYKTHLIKGHCIVPEVTTQVGGTCGAHAAVDTIEMNYRLRVLRRLSQNKLMQIRAAGKDYFPRLSIQSAVDRFERKPNHIILEWIRKKGIPTASSYPFKGHARKKKFCSEPLFGIQQYKPFNTKHTKYAIRQLLTYGPLIAALEVKTDFEDPTIHIYKGEGKDMDRRHSDGSMRSSIHMVPIIGLGRLNGVLYFHFINSYARDWGYKKDGTGKIYAEATVLKTFYKVTVRPVSWRPRQILPRLPPECDPDCSFEKIEIDENFLAD